MEQDLEEMEVVKFNWLMRDFCFRRFVNLKEACNYKAVRGIVLAIIFLVFGAGGSFLLAALRSHNITYQGLPEEAFAFEVGVESLVEGLVLFFLGLPEKACAFSVGVTSLVDGLLILIYSIILLNKVWNYGAGGVFKTIKVGCLIILYLQLIKSFLFCVTFVVLLMPLHLIRNPISEAGLICGLVGSVLALLLTTLGIYAVHAVKPKIVSMYIFITYIYTLVSSSIFLGYFVSEVYPALIIKFILIVMGKAFSLGLFVLHVNMMNIGIFSPNNKNQLQLNDF